MKSSDIELDTEVRPNPAGVEEPEPNEPEPNEPEPNESDKLTNSVTIKQNNATG